MALRRFSSVGLFQEVEKKILRGCRRSLQASRLRSQVSSGRYETTDSTKFRHAQK